MKTKNLYSGYKLSCDTCGERIGVFNSSEKNSKSDWELYYEIYTKPNHPDHTFRYVSTIKGATEKQFNKWAKENNIYHD